MPEQSRAAQTPTPVLVMYWGTRGGGAQMQERIAHAMSRRTDVRLALSFDAGSEVAVELAARGAPTLIVGRSGQLSALARAKRFAWQLADAVKLARFCQANHIEVIFEVMDHPLQSIPVALAKRRRRVLLGSIHDARRHPGERSFILDAFSWVSRWSRDGFMTYSDFVAKDVIARWPSLREAVFPTVHAALGRPTREEPRTAIEGRIPKVGFVGRISQYKGIERLLMAAEIVRSRGLSIDLVIAGRGHMSERERSLARALGAQVDNRWLAVDELPTIVDGLDILALPYSEASQSGLVGLALNAALPMVCTPTGGLREQVSTTYAGVVSDDMTAESFADSLEAILRDPDLYRSLSENAIDARAHAFGWDTVVSDIVCAYSTLLGRRTPRGSTLD